MSTRVNLRIPDDLNIGYFPNIVLIRSILRVRDIGYEYENLRQNSPPSSVAAAPPPC